MVANPPSCFFAVAAGPWSATARRPDLLSPNLHPELFRDPIGSPLTAPALPISIHALFAALCLLGRIGSVPGLSSSEPRDGCRFRAMCPHRANTADMASEDPGRQAGEPVGRQSPPVGRVRYRSSVGLTPWLDRPLRGWLDDGRRHLRPCPGLFPSRPRFPRVVCCPPASPGVRRMGSTSGTVFFVDGSRGCVTDGGDFTLV